jgi:thioredoxin-like negative regulator of GroEL
MSRERLEQLRAMLEEEPGDVFLRYAIALEQKRMGAMDEAIASLRALLHDAPDHIPSHHQLALLLADAGRNAEARDACLAGLERCRSAGDRKAAAEIGELLNALEDA